MADTITALDSLAELLGASSRPIYAVDERRRIAYCNAALAAWLDLEPARIVGRVVEYHSEPGASRSTRDDGSPLTDLCPPPRSLAGEACSATISCVARSGGLVHRRADFIPLSAGGEAPARRRGGVLVILAARDLTPQELAAEVSGEPSADELHRVLRQFRRGQAAQYAMESLVGESSAMRKVRSQVLAAAASGANVIVYGRRGAGRGHIARAIHYRAAGDSSARLVPLDCELAGEEVLRRSLEAVRATTGEARQRATLLLENLDRLTPTLQARLSELSQHNALSARIIATCSRHTASAVGQSESVSEPAGAADRAAPAIDAGLLDAVSTISIDVPRLSERLVDLPILVQAFLEKANRGSDKQIGSVRGDALDLLALYSWPGELDELRDVIGAAHRACGAHQITPADLPAVIHHASKAAARAQRRPERIELDDLLSNIEREAIVRALAQAGGNKTEAAELLGMTRPRLYRRLVQLGLAGPEFIEHEPGESS
jgi:DNA-binding NtrC family response regulator